MATLVATAQIAVPVRRGSERNLKIQWKESHETFEIGKKGKLVMTFFLENLFGATKAQRDALRKSRTDGYLVVPDEGDDPHLLTLYGMERHLRGLTGVALDSPGELGTSITVLYHGPVPFDRLLKAAEELGVEVDVSKPDRGYLVGWIDNDVAHDVAKQLVVLPRSPDPTESNGSSSAPRDCQHRPPSKGKRGGVRKQRWTSSAAEASTPDKP